MATMLVSVACRFGRLRCELNCRCLTIMCPPPPHPHPPTHPPTHSVLKKRKRGSGAIASAGSVGVPAGMEAIPIENKRTDALQWVPCCICGRFQHAQCSSSSSSSGGGLDHPSLASVCCCLECEAGALGGVPVASGATLIICPQQLRQQWRSEIDRHTHKPSPSASVSGSPISSSPLQQQHPHGAISIAPSASSASATSSASSASASPPLTPSALRVAFYAGVAETTVLLRKCAEAAQKLTLAIAGESARVERLRSPPPPPDSSGARRGTPLAVSTGDYWDLVDGDTTSVPPIRLHRYLTSGGEVGYRVASRIEADAAASAASSPNSSASSAPVSVTTAGSLFAASTPLSAVLSTAAAPALPAPASPPAAGAEDSGEVVERLASLLLPLKHRVTDATALASNPLARLLELTRAKGDVEALARRLSSTLSPRYLASCDVVITAYSTLAGDIHHADKTTAEFLAPGIAIGRAAAARGLHGSCDAPATPGQVRVEIPVF